MDVNRVLFPFFGRRRTNQLEKNFQGVDRDTIWMAGPSDRVGRIPTLYLLAQGSSIPD